MCQALGKSRIPFDKVKPQGLRGEVLERGEIRHTFSRAPTPVPDSVPPPREMVIKRRIQWANTLLVTSFEIRCQDGMFATRADFPLEGGRGASSSKVHQRGRDLGPRAHRGEGAGPTARAVVDDARGQGPRHLRGQARGGTGPGERGRTGALIRPPGRNKPLTAAS